MTAPRHRHEMDAPSRLEKSRPRRPRPPRTGAGQPGQQRDQVLAARWHDRRRACASDRTAGRVQRARSGRGHPGTQLDAVFGLFYQAEDPVSRRTGGMGLGLYISKEIISSPRRPHLGRERAGRRQHLLRAAAAKAGRCRRPSSSVTTLDLARAPGDRRGRRTGRACRPRTCRSRACSVPGGQAFGDQDAVVVFDAFAGRPARGRPQVVGGLGVALRDDERACCRAGG